MLSIINAVVAVLACLIHTIHSSCLSTKGARFKEYPSMLVNLTPHSEFQITHALECLLACENDAKCNSLNVVPKVGNKVICELLSGNKETGGIKQSPGSTHYEIASEVEETVGAAKPWCEPECRYVPSCKADRAASCRCLNRMMFSLNKGNHVQVGPSGNRFATIAVDVPSGWYKLKLVSYTGFISCAGFDPSRMTNFGCLIPGVSNRIMMVVTDNKNAKLLPGANGYSHDGRTSQSDFVTFEDPVYLTNGQELRVWYSEDLEDASESDNSGLTLFYVAAIG